jgi:hypothetical protein
MIWRMKFLEIEAVYGGAKPAQSATCNECVQPVQQSLRHDARLGEESYTLFDIKF